MNGCDMAGGVLSDIGFAIPLVALIPLIYSHIPRLDVYMEENFGPNTEFYGSGALKHYRDAKWRFSFGIVIALVAAAIWIVNEKIICPNARDWAPYVPAHAVWHILMPYGFSMLLVFLVCVKSIAIQIRRSIADGVMHNPPSFHIKSVNERILKTYCCPKIDQWLNKVFPIPSTRLHTPNSDERHDNWDTQLLKKCLVDSFNGGFCFCIRDCFCTGPVPNPEASKEQLSTELMVKHGSIKLDSEQSSNNNSKAENEYGTFSPPQLS